MENIHTHMHRHKHTHVDMNTDAWKWNPFCIEMYSQAIKEIRRLIPGAVGFWTAGTNTDWGRTWGDFRENDHIY